MQRPVLVTPAVGEDVLDVGVDGDGQPGFLLGQRHAFKPPPFTEFRLSIVPVDMQQPVKASRERTLSGSQGTGDSFPEILCRFLLAHVCFLLLR